MNQLKLVLNAPARYWSGSNMVVSAATPTSQLRLIADILDVLPAALTVTVTLLDTQRHVSTLEMAPEDISLDGARAFVTVKHPTSIWDILPMDRQKTDRYQVILTVETL